MCPSSFLLERIHKEGFAALGERKSALYMEGNTLLTLLGCLSIAQYENNFLRLLTPEGTLLLKGENFVLEEMQSQRVTVRGKIQAVSFNYFGKEG